MLPAVIYDLAQDTTKAWDEILAARHSVLPSQVLDVSPCSPPPHSSDSVPCRSTGLSNSHLLGKYVRDPRVRWRVVDQTNNDGPTDNIGISILSALGCTTTSALKVGHCGNSSAQQPRCAPAPSER